MDVPEPQRPSSRAWTELLHAEVAHLLRREGLRVLHIKGPTVTRWLWADGERPWGDVDVLVPPADLERALAVLRAHGLAERYPGVNRRTSGDHAVVLARTDPQVGLDEVDVHDRFPGIDGDADDAFDELWRRREPAQLAGLDVWFPDPSTRALLLALNAARTPGHRTRTDLTRLLAADLDWDDVVELAERVGAMPALRAGLELDPAGPAVVRATRLAGVEVSVEWQLRLADAPRTALRLDELGRLPWHRRVPAVVRWVAPPPPVVRMRDPRARGGPAALTGAYLRRLGDGVRALPPSVREVRRRRSGQADKGGGAVPDSEA